MTAEGVSSIKQVLPTIKNKFVGATSGRPRAFNERPYITKGQRFFVSVLFYTPCTARYSVLHLSGVLSGEGGPPFTHGSLWFVRPESPSAVPESTAFAETNAYCYAKPTTLNLRLIRFAKIFLKSYL